MPLKMVDGRDECGGLQCLVEDGYVLALQGQVLAHLAYCNEASAFEVAR